MRSRRLKIVKNAACAAGLLLVFAAGCEKKAAGSGDTKPSAPSQPRPAAWAQPLSAGSISYFNAQCTSCHGQYGVQIADHNIARSSSAGDYRGMVEYMVTERAGSSLPPRELDAETAYCASLAAVTEGVKSEGAPIFVCIKAPVNEGGLEGEVTPGSTVTFITAKGQVRIDAAVDAHNWSIPPMQVRNARQAAGDDWVNATVEARKDGKTQVLRLSEEAWKGPKLIPPAPRAPANPPSVKP